MLPMTRRLLLLTLSAALLSGCGFALRGSVNLSESISRVVVEGSDLEMVDQLEDALETNGASIAPSGDKQAAVLELTLSEFTRDVRTTDANGLATSYTLRYRVGYDVRTAAGDELQINQRLVQKRVFDYDPLQQLQSEEEEEFLKEEMQEEVVLQILRRLSRI